MYFRLGSGRYTAYCRWHCPLIRFMRLFRPGHYSLVEKKRTTSTTHQNRPSSLAHIFTAGLDHVSHEPPTSMPAPFPSPLKFAEAYEDDSISNTDGFEFNNIRAGSGGSESENGGRYPLKPAVSVDTHMRRWVDEKLGEFSRLVVASESNLQHASHLCMIKRR